MKRSDEIIRCPACGSENLLVERQPDGSAKCDDCKWYGKYSYCFQVIDGNIHVIPIDPFKHVENENCICNPEWDADNRKDFNFGLTETKMFVHKKLTELLQ